MSAHADSLIDEILSTLAKMGEDADLDFCENLDEYEDHLYDLSDDELYDTYSMVEMSYERWLKRKKEAKNVNTTGH